MRDHIHTVVGRYKGRIQTWDVVNEALNEDGTLRQSLWYKIIGPDYIAKAFEYAHEADPQAQLTYNDYNLENEAKRNGAIALIKKLKAEGVPINCVGIQDHDNLTWPTTEQEDATISAFARSASRSPSRNSMSMSCRPPLHQQTADVSVNVAQNPKLNPWPNGLPDSVQQELAKRYADLFGVFLKHRADISRVTFWGVTDGDSWKNDWPVKGRTNYPLLFDRRWPAQAGLRCRHSRSAEKIVLEMRRRPGELSPSGVRLHFRLQPLQHLVQSRLPRRKLESRTAPSAARSTKRNSAAVSPASDTRWTQSPSPPDVARRAGRRPSRKSPRQSHTSSSIRHTSCDTDPAHDAGVPNRPSLIPSTIVRVASASAIDVVGAPT